MKSVEAPPKIYVNQHSGSHSYMKTSDQDMTELARHYLLHVHRSPLNNILHQADLKIEMQYHKDIESAFKAGYVQGQTQRVNNKSYAIDFGYLQNWYQDSIDPTIEPIWTDKLLKELFKDFYLIPKK